MCVFGGGEGGWGGIGRGREAEGDGKGGLRGMGVKTYLPVSSRSVFHFNFMTARRMVMLSR